MVTNTKREGVWWYLLICDINHDSSITINGAQDYFSRDKDAPKNSDEDEFFMGDAPKPAVVSEERKTDQTKVDAVLLKQVAQVPMLEGYLAARFTLTASDKPHKMVFWSKKRLLHYKRTTTTTVYVSDGGSTAVICFIMLVLELE